MITNFQGYAIHINCVALFQRCQTLLLKVQFPADFSSNLAPKHLFFIFYYMCVFKIYSLLYTHTVRQYVKNFSFVTIHDSQQKKTKYYIFQIILQNLA